MLTIVVVLIAALVLFVVVFNGIQQRREKIEAEKRAKMAKQKAILDETEELLMAMTVIPPSLPLTKVLHKRSWNAASSMLEIYPNSNDIKKRATELESRYNVTSQQVEQPSFDEGFILPDNDQQLLAILQCIKKLRAVLRSEQSKGSLDPQEFMREDLRLETYQLRINVESLLKRGQAAQAKEMIGSARQYYEKALKIVTDHPRRNEYTVQKKEEIENILYEITSALKNSNAEDRAKRAKNEQDDLDVLFQPKKKW
jgi:hypothetical protein